MTLSIKAVGELVPTDAGTTGDEDAVVGSCEVVVDTGNEKSWDVEDVPTSSFKWSSLFEEVADDFSRNIGTEDEAVEVEDFSLTEKRDDEEIIFEVVVAAGKVMDGAIDQIIGASDEVCSIGVEDEFKFEVDARVRYAEFKSVKASKVAFWETSFTSEAKSLCHFATEFELEFEITETFVATIL